MNFLACRHPPDEGTKHERISKSFAALPDTDLPKVTEKILTHQVLNAKTRNAIQDVQLYEAVLAERGIGRPYARDGAMVSADAARTRLG